MAPTAFWKQRAHLEDEDLLALGVHLCMQQAHVLAQVANQGLLAFPEAPLRLHAVQAAISNEQSYMLSTLSATAAPHSSAFSKIDVKVMLHKG
jgi:hypothetical protein